LFLRSFDILVHHLTYTCGFTTSSEENVTGRWAIAGDIMQGKRPSFFDLPCKLRHHFYEFVGGIKVYSLLPDESQIWLIAIMPYPILAPPSLNR